jgi:hypothetical protein
MNSPLAKMGKKISGANKYEKKSGKRLESPEQVEAVDRQRARQFVSLGQSFLQQQQQNMLFQQQIQQIQQIQQNQAMNNLAEIGRQNMMLTQNMGVMATNSMFF